jgi:hypothetical protein
MTYTICLIGFVIILLYCVFAIIYNKEIPNSISQIVYSLSDKWKWTFTIVMFVVGFFILPRLIDVISDPRYTFLGFLTTLGILGVGADPLVKGESNIIHYVSAIIMGVSSQIIVYMNMPSLLWLWIPYIVYTLYENKADKNMFIAEIIMLIALGAVCLI